jgi:hypothetical protein
MKTKTIGFKVKNGKRTETFYQEPKQETLEEFAKQEAVKQYSEDTFGNLIVRKSIEKGAKWQQEQILDFLYSEITERRDYSASKMCEKVIEFIEQFKNK